MQHVTSVFLLKLREGLSSVNVHVKQSFLITDNC